MAIHDEVLDAARRLCRDRADWRFTPIEVVNLLGHLNASSIRTHIVSRCCVNAPSHHQHRWPYFTRIQRGVYEIRAGLRVPRLASQGNGRQGASRERVSESAATYRASEDIAVRPAIHAVVVKSNAWYVAECLEVAVVTQGRTLDETVSNLREAIALHLRDDEWRRLDIAPTPRLVISYEPSLVEA